jgi:hypothetical protein
VASKQFDQIIVQGNRVAELPGFLNLKLRFSKILYGFGAVFLGFGQKDRSRTPRVDPVRKRCVVQTFHCTGRHTCLSVPDLQVPRSLVRMQGLDDS